MITGSIRDKLKIPVKGSESGNLGRLPDGIMQFSRMKVCEG